MLKTKPVSEVSEIIAKTFGREHMDAEVITLENALGRVLSENINASAYIPDFDRSTKDGYAVIAADVAGCSESSPAILKLIGASRMGNHTALELTAGECAYVPTGGEVPHGTEAMVMLEDSQILDDGQMAILNPVPAGTDMIFRGEDMKPGDLVIPAGKRLKIADIGTLAAMGIVTVPVMKCPRVGIISTGDELVPAGEKLSRVGLIRDANDPMLQQAIRVSGGDPIAYGIVKDNQEKITALVQTAIGECDMLLISGGTSMDSKDTVTAIIDELGQVIVHGVTLKPGKPTIFGSIQGKPVFGLPGNPVAVYFTFHLFVRPLLHSLQGTKPVDRKVSAPLARTFRTDSGREEYVPIILKDGFAQPIAFKSGLITTVSCADGYMIIPHGCSEVTQGTIVEVTFLDR